jgi:hypothetical protein
METPSRTEKEKETHDQIEVGKVHTQIKKKSVVYEMSFKRLHLCSPLCRGEAEEKELHARI